MNLRVPIRRDVALAIVCLTPPLANARAQCADGSPPPCPSVNVAAAPRRVNPPLDDRTWIVVPFDNLARNQEVDWLREASVNLLYLDMSRWRDIRVIDDERVADLMREVLEANTQSLSLNAGLAVAKRAGAGKLVMGDVLKLGSRTAVTAKVFDVRNGQRIRSVREETAVQDSVMPLFGKLAQRILNVAPPQGANVGALGTSRVDAYQEYIAGVKALNHFDVTEARKRLEKALSLDTSFALAHYRLSIVTGWDNSADRSGIRTHAEAAGRMASGLPARERALISGQLWHARGDEGRACAEYSQLLRADSSDVEAWYGLGECSYHDFVAEAADGDTTKIRFRGDWNRAVRAFERVLRLDPTYHLAYQHIIDVLAVERHVIGCYRADPTARCTNYAAFLVRSGDSLLIVPVALGRDSAKLRSQADEYVRTQSRRRNLELAHQAAAAWVNASPADQRARSAFARVLNLQGRTEEALAELARLTKPVGLVQIITAQVQRLEAAFKLGRMDEAIRIYDSLRANSVPIPGAQRGLTPGNVIALYGPAFGRLTEYDSAWSAALRQEGAADRVVQYRRTALRTTLGMPSDDLAAVERAAFDQVNAARGAAAATRTISNSLSYALRSGRPSWPALDTSLRAPSLRPALTLARGDTAGLRSSARALDSILSATIANSGADSGFAMIAAESYLALRDSAAALAVVRRALDRVVATTLLFPVNDIPDPPVVFLTPRMMLLRADLAAAMGHRDEARLWYKRFIDVWSTAVPELQPVVERARKAHAALGGT